MLVSWVLLAVAVGGPSWQPGPVPPLWQPGPVPPSGPLWQLPPAKRPLGLPGYTEFGQNVLKVQPPNIVKFNICEEVIEISDKKSEVLGGRLDYCVRREAGVRRIRGCRGELVVTTWGDTLMGIARREGVDWRLVAEQNFIPSPYILYPGDKICIRKDIVDYNFEANTNLPPLISVSQVSFPPYRERTPRPRDPVLPQGSPPTLEPSASSAVAPPASRPVHCPSAVIPQVGMSLQDLVAILGPGVEFESDPGVDAGASPLPGSPLLVRCD
jgi:hypothetical protein